MNLSQLENLLKPYPAYRFNQVKQAIFSQLIDSWDKTTNLPFDLREKLKQECPLSIKTKIFRSKDKTTAKAVIFFNDNEAVETVLMQHEDGRNTVCVSSQIGCALKCSFCATGQMDFKRNLTAHEIVEQVLLFARLLKKEQKRVTNVVFMGMGEPFLNYEAVLSAIRILNDKNGLNIGARHISISTAGIISGIKKLAQEKLQINLAFSLHAPNNELRNGLMPINKKFSLNKVMTELKKYLDKTKRRLAIEYLMLKDVNDSERQAQELADLLKKYLGGLFFVNLIGYNETGRYESSTSIAVKKFKEMLEKRGMTVVERYRFGHDIKGACGQLAAKTDESF